MQPDKKHKKLQLAACIAAAALLTPATILLNALVIKGNFYLPCTLILLYAMLPFAVSFEKSAPQARQLTVLAVMCAIVVVSRWAFVFVPHFKPMTAIIMLTGIALGARSGFMAGAVSAFVSNFIFGQGPWTPWQMLAFGMAGFLAGLLFSRKRPGRIVLALFGGVCVLAVTGPILDTSSLLYITTLNWGSVGAVYLSGLPVNAVHALATVLTLLVAGKPLLEMLDRIKMKYGLTKNEL